MYDFANCLTLFTVTFAFTSVVKCLKYIWQDPIWKLNEPEKSNEENHQIKYKNKIPIPYGWVETYTQSLIPAPPKKGMHLFRALLCLNHLFSIILKKCCLNGGILYCKMFKLNRFNFRSSQMCSCQAFNAEIHCLKKCYFRAVCLLNSNTLYIYLSGRHLGDIVAGGVGRKTTEGLHPVKPSSRNYCLSCLSSQLYYVTKSHHSVIKDE